MAFLGVDLGGTKLSLAVFNQKGEITCANKIPLGSRTGREVGSLISDEIRNYLNGNNGYPIEAIGISVPGISRRKSGTVWAPNIPEWDDYPLLKEVEEIAGEIPITIESDRACYILGEMWQGNARGANDAVFLAVGTGIGAGILTNGVILRGAHDIAGAIGWMALGRPFETKYKSCGFFEYHASGEGIANVAREMIDANPDYTGLLKPIAAEKLTAVEIFEAFDQNDAIAVQVLQLCIEYWGMATANLISLFNPEKIIFGGGVFGPATSFIPAIQKEANKWAQPISATQVKFEQSALGDKAGVYGAGFLALKSVHPYYLNQEYV
jgi:glucokinase